MVHRRNKRIDENMKLNGKMDRLSKDMQEMSTYVWSEREKGEEGKGGEGSFFHLLSNLFSEKSKFEPLLSRLSSIQCSRPMQPTLRNGG